MSVLWPAILAALTTWPCGAAGPRADASRVDWFSAGMTVGRDVPVDPGPAIGPSDTERPDRRTPGVPDTPEWLDEESENSESDGLDAAAVLTGMVMVLSVPLAGRPARDGQVRQIRRFERTYCLRC
jgi:hypothetical protein